MIAYEHFVKLWTLTGNLLTSLGPVEPGKGHCGEGPLQRRY